MEARASFGTASVSKTFVTAILVIVAMGLAAAGGYVAKGLSGGAVTTQSQRVYAAPGTVLRQDNPSRAAAELPGYVLQEIAPRATQRIAQDDPSFIAKYGATSQLVDYSWGRAGH